MDDLDDRLAEHQRRILEAFALRRHTTRRRWRGLRTWLGLR